MTGKRIHLGAIKQSTKVYVSGNKHFSINVRDPRQGRNRFMDPAVLVLEDTRRGLVPPAGISLPSQCSVRPESLGPPTLGGRGAALSGHGVGSVASLHGGVGSSIKSSLPFRRKHSSVGKGCTGDMPEEDLGSPSELGAQENLCTWGYSG